MERSRTSAGRNVGFKHGRLRSWRHSRIAPRRLEPRPECQSDSGIDGEAFVRSQALVRVPAPANALPCFESGRRTSMTIHLSCSRARPTSDPAARRSAAFSLDELALSAVLTAELSRSAWERAKASPSPTRRCESASLFLHGRSKPGMIASIVRRRSGELVFCAMLPAAPVGYRPDFWQQLPSQLVGQLAHGPDAPYDPPDAGDPRAAPPIETAAHAVEHHALRSTQQPAIRRPPGVIAHPFEVRLGILPQLRCECRGIKLRTREFGCLRDDDVDELIEIFDL